MPTGSPTTRRLGPQLREVGSLSTDYYGFDTTVPPFDDVRVRQAFAAAVDWRRIGHLAVDEPEDVATSMVPPGIPGRSERDVVPLHDPDRARALLAEAGFPGGAGFPVVTILSGGSPYDDAVIAELERELGIDVQAEYDGLRRLLRAARHGRAGRCGSCRGSPTIPGRNDFLGVLLGTGSVNNYGRWSSPGVRRGHRRRRRGHRRGRGRRPPTTAPRTSSSATPRSSR